MHINNGLNKNSDDIIEKITIVDFNKYNGLPIREVQTKWGEGLVDFHRNLLKSSPYYQENCIFYDASSWLKETEETLCIITIKIC